MKSVQSLHSPVSFFELLSPIETCSTCEVRDVLSALLAQAVAWCSLDLSGSVQPQCFVSATNISCDQQALATAPRGKVLVTTWAALVVVHVAVMVVVPAEKPGTDDTFGASDPRIVMLRLELLFASEVARSL